MITFSVEGKPAAQGSQVAFVPVSPNADIELAVDAARRYGQFSQSTDTGPSPARYADAARRLAVVGKWPVWTQHKPGAKTPGHFVASMHASNAGPLGKWRKAIAKAAREAYDGAPLFMPVIVELTFTFVRPAAHWRTGKRADELHEWAPKFHTSMPDVDKLTRAVLDALTQSGVIVDDAIVAETAGEKLWSDVKGRGDGVEVMITHLPESGACREWARKRHEKRKAAK